MELVRSLIEVVMKVLLQLEEIMIVSKITNIQLCCSKNDLQ